MPRVDPAERMMAQVEKSLKQPPPFKLVELPSAIGKDIAENERLEKQDGPKTTEFWQARGEPGKYGGTFRTATFGSGPKTLNFWASDDADSGGVDK